MTDQSESRNIKAATIVFFVALLVIGLFVYRDYGISWDEFPTRKFGYMNVLDVVPDAATLDSVRAADGPAFERFGPAFEILLVRGELLLHSNDLRLVMQMRHLANFLIFYIGVVFFYLFCRRRFRPGIALLSCVCLVLSPLLFSHAFYNVKDIAFLTMFVASMLTLDTVLDDPRWRTVLVHAIATGILVGTRILGIFAMLLTGVAALARRPSSRTVLFLLAYGVVVMLVLPVVWPVMRLDPIGIIKDAVLGSTTNPYNNTDLFRGTQYPATALPWDYVPTWILITTPIVITALFVVGVLASILGVVRKPIDYLLREKQRDVIVLSWFFLPVIGCVVLRPILYDSWRHLFFIYPALVYLAAVGMETIVTRAERLAGEEKRRLVSGVLTGALLLCLAPVVAFMVRNHPFEHVYFNRLAGRDMAEIKQRFELDYWGLSYRKALEYIVSTDTSSIIRIHGANFPAAVNSVMLSPSDRARVRFVPMSQPADYFITNYRFHPQPYPYAPEVFGVRVGNASIASVFLLRHTP
ncbi:MAG: glycosyltransferase family 39 protein [bacterium]